MSTNAIFTFKAKGQSTFNVYAHWDGYPSGAVDYIQTMLESGKAWTLPRFETDEIACGFIAANKTQGGNFRLAKTRNHFGGIEWAYTIYIQDSVLMVKCESVDNWDKWESVTVFNGPFSEFIVKADSLE